MSDLMIEGTPQSRSSYQASLSIGPDVPVLACSGALEARLASTPNHVRAAQELRYRVFFEELGAIASESQLSMQVDADPLDDICDHLIVTDISAASEPKIVATYRLLPQDVASLCGGFYSASEFDIAPILRRFSGLKFLELGRSCVHSDYRNKRTMELLWHGLWTYVRQRKFDVMFGCASLPGTSPERHADAFRLIRQESRTPQQWQAFGAAGRGIDTTAFSGPPENPKAALKSLPPLIKAYLRLGAYFSNDAVVDHQFNTTDLLVTLPVTAIRKRYFEKFGSPDETSARASRPRPSNDTSRQPVMS